MICEECKASRHTYCEAPATCPCQHRVIGTHGKPMTTDELRHLAESSPTLYGDLTPQ